MSNERIIQWVCILIAIGGIAGSALLAPVLNRQRRNLQLSFDIEIGNQVPPEYALLAAMGSLRGIAVDMAWYRAEMLKREGKFHESNTLAEFITTMQPRFPAVWAFHAWNLAYNISVETHTPQERYDWVTKGVRLMRDEGLVYNPTSVLLYKELGWILFHKMGKDSDDAHWYYKQMWAKEWTEVLGEPRKGKVEGERDENGRPVWLATRDFKAIADAATTYFPEDRKVDPVTMFLEDHPDIVPLVEAIRDADFDIDASSLRRIGQFLVIKPYVRDLKRILEDAGDQMDPKDRAAITLVTDDTLGPLFETFLPIWRAKALIEDYHMKPAKMHEIMGVLGPLDWRHPASHAAYFGYLGVEMSGEIRDDSKVDVLNTDRGVIHAMQLLTETGDVVYDPLSGRIDMLPDPRFIYAYDAALDNAVARQEEVEFTGQGNADNFASGHENFLIKASLYAYLYGDIEESRRYFDKSRRLYADRPHNQRSGRYLKPLDDFVLSEYVQDWDMAKVVRAFIEGNIRQGVLRGLANNRMEVFGRFTSLAKRGYERYQEKRGYSNLLTERARLGLPPTWRETLSQVYANLMRAPSLPLIDRARIWSNTPFDLQLETYVMFRPQVRQQCSQQGIHFERAFPPPPGFVEPTAPTKGDEQPLVPSIERQ